MASKFRASSNNNEQDKPANRNGKKRVIVLVSSLIAFVCLCLLLAAVFSLIWVDLRGALYPLAGFFVFGFSISGMIAIFLSNGLPTPEATTVSTQAGQGELLERLYTLETRLGSLVMEEYSVLRERAEKMEEELQAIETARQRKRESEIERLHKRNAELEQLLKQYHSATVDTKKLETGVTNSADLEEGFVEMEAV